VALVIGLIFGLPAGLVVGLLAGLLRGFSREQLTERLMLAPNEGIHRSLKNGLVVGLAAGLPFGLIGGLIVGLVGGLTTVALVDTARKPGGRKKIPSSSCVSPVRWSCTCLHEDRKSVHLMHGDAGRLVVRRPVILSAQQS